jgi:hypothetical protein
MVGAGSAVLSIVAASPRPSGRGLLRTLPHGMPVGNFTAGLNNFRNVKPVQGVHDVVAHGTTGGYVKLDGEVTNGG